MGRTRVLGVVALVVLQGVVLVSLALVGPSEDPNRAPLRVVAPPVVATSLVDRADTLPGRPFAAVALRTEAEARRSIEQGRSVAAVVVDLRLDRDTLYLAGANGDALNTAVRVRVADVERSFGRDVDVQDLVPARSGDAGHRAVYAMVAVCALLGFVVALVVTWAGGPTARTWVRGAQRLAVVGAVSVVAGAVVAAGGALRYEGLAVWWVVGALTVFVVAVTTLALESVFGVLGLGVATTLFVLAAAPLVRLTNPLMLPGVWASVTPWLPHGAALEAMTGEAYFGGPPARPLLVLVVWALLAVLTMLVARHERPRPA